MITPSMVDAVLGFLFGNLWRTAALALAVVAGWKSLQLDSAQQALAIAEGRAEIAEGNEKLTATSWELAGAQLQVELSACQAQWVAVTERSGYLIAQALAEATRAADELSAFRSKWEARTQQCGAMLLEMERACPELADY